MSRNRSVRASACALVVMVGCSLGGCAWGRSAHECRPPAGGRCAGPEPIQTDLVGSLRLSNDGRTIFGAFMCGGKLTATEDKSRATLTFVATVVGAGGRSCATLPTSVRLHDPIGGRVAIDRVSGQPVAISTSEG